MAHVDKENLPPTWVHIESRGAREVYVDANSENSMFIVVDSDGYYDRRSSLKLARELADKSATKRTKIEFDVWLRCWQKDDQRIASDRGEPEEILRATYLGVNRSTGKLSFRIHKDGTKVETTTATVWAEKAINPDKFSRLVELVAEVQAHMAPLEERLDRLRASILKLPGKWGSVYLHTHGGSMSIERANKYDSDNLREIEASGPS